MKAEKRRSFRQLGGILSGDSVLAGQPGGGPPDDGLVPVLELVNVPEFEEMARLTLSPENYEAIRGGYRGSFEKMTFRQRLMVYAMDLDLTTEVFGYEMFAPIIIGPVAMQGDLHVDGELGTARGASAAKAVMVAASNSSYPISSIVAASDEPVWYQLYADVDGSLEKAVEAVEAGCKAVCVTIGVSSDRVPVSPNWDTIAAVIRAVDVPVVVKGVMSPDVARIALDHGAEGLVVSDHGEPRVGPKALPIDVLPAVFETVDGRVPVIVDGSFRRGTDLLKALALGATAVMVARPAMWGLAAYGGEGVQMVLELLQTELARNMAASGRPRIDMIDRELVRFDSR